MEPKPGRLDDLFRGGSAADKPFDVFPAKWRLTEEPAFHFKAYTLSSCL